MLWRTVETAIVVAAGSAIFGSPARLGGPLLYDDKAAVQRNPVVSGEVPLARVWDLDFWGEHELHTAESHKSFRPVVTLTYAANYALHGHEPWGYHAANAALHALNCALIPPTVRAAFGWREPDTLLPFVTALLFAVHPVHVEAVQQIVGRAELLMALFFLLGFLAYAHLALGAIAGARGAAPPRVGARGVGACTAALVCTLLATLSKETGVTLPLLCIGWEALVVLRLRPAEALLLRRRRAPADAAAPAPAAATSSPAPASGADTTSADGAPTSDESDESGSGCDVGGGDSGGPPWPCVAASAVRCALLVVGLLAIAVWRQRRNGDTAASISPMQNLPGFLPHRGWRAVSIAWVWAEYLWTLIVPLELCPDWSYPAVPPIEAADDVRVPLLLAFLMGWAIFWARCALLRTAPRALVAVVGFGVVPFLLASNLLFPVGTCKAERVLYLPSVGGCMAAALALQAACRGGAPCTLVGAVAVAAPLAWQCDEFATTWTDGVELWAQALRVQEARGRRLVGGATTSAMCEYGMQLSWAGRNAEAEPALERVVAEAELVIAAQMAKPLAAAAAESSPPLSPFAADKAGGGREAWGTRGFLDMCGFMPLSLVIRLNRRPKRALEVAERCEAVVAALGMGGDAEGRKTLARCLSARAMALYDVERAEAWPTMLRALEASRDAQGRISDGAVLNVAQQLLSALPPQVTQQPQPQHQHQQKQPPPPQQPQVEATPLAAEVAQEVPDHRHLPAARPGPGVATSGSRGGGGQWARRLEERRRAAPREEL